MYCSGQTGIAIMNKILVLIFALALAGKLSSQRLIGFEPRSSAKL